MKDAARTQAEMQAGRFHEGATHLAKPLIKVGNVLSFPPDTRLWGVIAIDARGFVLVPIETRANDRQ